MRKNLAMFAMLSVIAFLLYGHALNNPFVFDDELQILKNDFVQNQDWRSIFSGSSFGSFGKSQAAGIYYKPLMTSAYAVLWQLGGGKSFAFHLYQLLIGIANAFLFFRLLSRWVNAPIALAAAAIFLIHPINSEVLLYIADLQDTLYLFLGLLAINLVQSKKSILLITFCMLASIFSKESGILFIFAAPVYAFMFKKEDFRKIGLISIACLALYLSIRFYILQMTTLSYQMVPIASLNIIDRMLHFPKIFFHYITTFLWPRQISLHQLWTISSINFENFYKPLFGSFLFLAFIIWTFNKVARPIRKWLLFFLVLLVLNTGLHSQIIVPLDATVADRWFYLGSMALIGYFAILVKQFANSIVKKRISLVLFLVVFTALSIRSYQRSLQWNSGIELLSEAFETSPYDPAYADALGGEFYRIGNLDKAEFYFRKSATLEPMEWSAWNNLGTVEVQKGNETLAEKFYLKAIENDKYCIAVVNYVDFYISRNDGVNLKLTFAWPEAIFQIIQTF